MMIDKSEREIRNIVDDWASAYFRGEIYGFGLSDEMGFATFFEEDMGRYEPTSIDMQNLHKVGFRADTHRTGHRIGKGFRVKAVFDNNPIIQNTNINGYKILAPSDIPKMGNVKIAIFPRRYYTIKKQLESYGLKEYEDFIYYNFFVAFYNYFIQKKILIWKATIGLTSRCTLRCKDCNMFIPFYKEPADVPFDELSTDLDVLFSRVHYVQWFGILGGEPLIYRDLPRYLKRVNEYSRQIGEVIIDTNGSVEPDDALLDFIREMGNLRIMVNDYNINHGYEKKVAKVIDKIKSSGVSYTLRSYDWNLYKRDNAIGNEEEVKCHYIRCNQVFTAFQNKRFYACHIPWSAARCGIGFDDPKDYLDFSDSSVTDLDIVKAGLGHLERGYTSNCAICNGCDPVFLQPIQKALQL